MLLQFGVSAEYCSRFGCIKWCVVYGWQLIMMLCIRWMTTTGVATRIGRATDDFGVNEQSTLLV